MWKYFDMRGHPMGEAKRRQLVVRQQAAEVLGLQSASGPLKVRWDDNAQATGRIVRVRFSYVAQGRSFSTSLNR